MKTLKQILIVLSVLTVGVWPVAAQEAGFISSLFGGGEIRENIVFRYSLDDDRRYLLTMHGSRVEGDGYLEIEIFDTETGEYVDGDSTLEVTLGPARNSINRAESATYTGDHWLVDDIAFVSDWYRMTVEFDGNEPYDAYMWVYPSAPETNSTVIAASLAAPVVFMMIVLGAFRIFGVQFLPPPNKRIA